MKKVIIVLFMLIVSIGIVQAADFEFSTKYVSKTPENLVKFVIDVNNTGAEEINITISSFAIIETGVSGPSNWFKASTGTAWYMLTLQPGENGSFSGATHDIGHNFNDTLTVYVRLKDESTEEEINHTTQWFIDYPIGKPITPSAPIIDSPVNGNYLDSVNISWHMTDGEDYDLYQVQYTYDGFNWINLTTTTEKEYKWELVETQVFNVLIDDDAEVDNIGTLYETTSGPVGPMQSREYFWTHRADSKSNTGTGSYYGNDTGSEMSQAFLTSDIYSIPTYAIGGSLRFWLHVETEGGYDGCYLQYKTGESPWIKWDNQYLDYKYSSSIFGFNNSYNDHAWNGMLGEVGDVSALFPDDFIGEDVSFRFVMETDSYTDSGVNGESTDDGCWIDDLTLRYYTPVSGTGPLPEEVRVRSGEYSVRVRAQKDGVWGVYQMSGAEPERDYSDVLVLWVSNDEGSEEVADYYIQEMNIPPENKCKSSVSQGWGLDQIKRDTLQNETIACIRSLNHTINYVVYTRGMSIGYAGGFMGNPSKLSVDSTTMYFLVDSMYKEMYDVDSDGEPTYESNYDWYYPAVKGEFNSIENFKEYTTKNNQAEDAYVRGGIYKSDKFSFEDSFVVKLSDDDSVWSRKAVLKFYEPEIEQITSLESVNSAKLYLSSKWTSTPATLKLYATHKMWREKAVSWSIFPDIVEGDLLGTFTVTESDEEIVFDITEYVNSISMSEEEPLAFIIVNADNKYSQLWSSDAPYESLQPRIEFERGKKLLLFGRLDGWTIEEAKKLVDKSKSSWGKSGMVVLDQAHTSNDPINYYWSYGGYETSLKATRDLALSRGYDVVYNDVQGGEPNIYLTRNPAVAFWGSWGSNDGSVLAPAWTFNTWAPGAIIETAVSTSAAGVTGRPSSYGQSRIVDTMWEGASGGRGSVAEPYISGIGRPHIIFDAYTRGYSMAEAYSMGAAKVLWEDLILGDPKMTPYERSPFTIGE